MQRSRHEALTIRQERPDQPDVMRLIEALDAHAIALYPPESNHLLDISALCDDAVTFLVVRAGADAIGCGALLRDPRGWGELKRMYVRPTERGRGIGKRVLAELEAIARVSGLPLLRLETGIHNIEALALYRRAGFAARDAFGNYAPDPLSVFMEKSVNT
jgi:putative acetyltransferase